MIKSQCQGLIEKNNLAVLAVQICFSVLEIGLFLFAGGGGRERSVLNLSPPNSPRLARDCMAWGWHGTVLLKMALPVKFVLL